MNNMWHHITYPDYTSILQSILIIAMFIIVIKVLFGKVVNVESDKDFALRNMRLSYENGAISKEKYEEGLKEIENNM